MQIETYLHFLLRLNKWKFESTGVLGGVDIQARCQHKVEQDLVFLDISLSERPVSVFIYGPETNLLAQAITIGNTLFYRKNVEYAGN